MLRRIFDGLVLAILAWFLIVRLNAGEIALGLALAAVIAFTGWRIHRLWRKYQALLDELAVAEAEKLSDDPAAALRAERVLRARHVTQTADMTIWAGFVMGAAALDTRQVMNQGAYGGDMAGSADGMGGDFAGGGLMGGDMGGGDGGGM